MNAVSSETKHYTLFAIYHLVELENNYLWTAQVIIPSEQGSCWGVYWYHSIHPSVRLSVCLSVRSACRVGSVTSTVLDGFLIRISHKWSIPWEGVSHNDLWPWPISSRSFGLDLENHVCSVASTVLDGFFCIKHKWLLLLDGVSRVTFIQNLKIRIFGKFFGLVLEKNICSSRWILSIFSTNDH